MSAQTEPREAARDEVIRCVRAHVPLLQWMCGQRDPATLQPWEERHAAMKDLLRALEALEALEGREP